MEKKKEKVPKILQEALLNFRQMMELSSKQMDQNVFFFFMIILFFSRFFNVWSSGVLWRKLVFMSVMTSQFFLLIDMSAQASEKNNGAMIIAIEYRIMTH